MMKSSSFTVKAIVALKAASTAWRFMRYYGRGEEYVRRDAMAYEESYRKKVVKGLESLHNNG